MKSFQLARNEITVKVTIAGLALGRMIERKVRHGPAPSIRALSSSATGMVLKNCRMKNTPKALAAPGTMTASSVSNQPNRLRISKFGIMKMKGGKRVRDLLPAERRELPVVNHDDTIIEVAAIMARLRCPLAAVMKDRKLIGVISASRLLELALQPS